MSDGAGSTGAIAGLGVLSATAAAAALVWIIVDCRRGREARDAEFLEMSRRLTLATEVSRIGFWDADLETDALRWDARSCELMGVPWREGFFREADWLAAIHPEDRDRAVDAVAAAIAHSGHFIKDYRVVAEGGRVRHLRDMATVYRGADGHAHIAGLVWDVTADKEREAELDLRRHQAEAANKAKSSFLAAMSHEIRTPLAGVIGMLHLILDDVLEPRQVERARVAADSAQSLLQLLNDVLDLSKLEAEAMSLAPVPVNIRELIESTGKLLSPIAAGKQLSLAWQVEEDVPECVTLDPVRFRQILTNIASNGIAYTDEGFVRLDVRKAGGGEDEWLEAAVADSGIGISAADCDRVFDRFVQVGAAKARQSGGTGLGLAIARELVELMGGVIGVDSTPGAGSTFIFRVPAPRCAPPALPNAVPAPATRAAGPLDILVAEDNATNRFLIKSLLTKGGHNVRMVGNGREAVEAARQDLFDLILMDVQMPVMDGLEASRAIRALDPPNGCIPIAALTASALTEDHSRYQEAGVDACLAKPIDLAALGEVLAGAALRSSAAETAPCEAARADAGSGGATSHAPQVAR